MQANSLTQKQEVALLVLVLSLGFLAQLAMTLATDGGGDLLLAHAPATLILLQGQNPYLGDPWNSPYPPFFFLVLGGLVRAGSFGAEVGLDETVLILRLALVAAHVLLAALTYTVLRASSAGARVRLAVPALFLFLPSFFHMGEVWFHGDVFGLLLLTGSLLLFRYERWAWGSLLLSLAASFKVHPFLALPLLTIWFIRGKKPSLRNMVALILPFVFLTVLPLWLVPGYFESFIDYNAIVRPSWSVTPFILFYKVLPAYGGVVLSTFLVNRVWVAVTTLLYFAVTVATWRYGRVLGVGDVVVLGTAVWLLPLRQLFHHYVFWALVPFALRGRLKETLLVLVPFEAATDLATYLWGYYPGWAVSTEPMMVFLSVFDSMLLSVVLASCILFVWKDARVRLGGLEAE